MFEILRHVYLFPLLVCSVLHLGRNCLSNTRPLKTSHTNECSFSMSKRLKERLEEERQLRRVSDEKLK